jgi:hypothetical protein
LIILLSAMWTHCRDRLDHLNHHYHRWRDTYIIYQNQFIQSTVFNEPPTLIMLCFQLISCSVSHEPVLYNYYNIVIFIIIIIILLLYVFSIYPFIYNFWIHLYKHSQRGSHLSSRQVILVIQFLDTFIQT